jgi:hypothetical protein
MTRTRCRARQIGPFAGNRSVGPEPPSLPGRSLWSTGPAWWRKTSESPVLHGRFGKGCSHTTPMVETFHQISRPGSLNNFRSSSPGRRSREADRTDGDDLFLGSASRVTTGGQDPRWSGRFGRWPTHLCISEHRWALLCGAPHARNRCSKTPNTRGLPFVRRAGGRLDDRVRRGCPRACVRIGCGSTTGRISG